MKFRFFRDCKSKPQVKIPVINPAYQKNLAFFLMTSFLGCTSQITYKPEILNNPVGLVALEQTTPFAYTELSFYAYNLEVDFAGYKISAGATKAASMASTVFDECLFFKNSNLNIPTRIQVGGTSALPGFDCHIPAPTLTLTPASWVAVKSFGSRDCSLYPADSGCSPFSQPAVAEILPYIAPPASATIQYLTSPDVHYMVTVTMGANPAGFSGFGLFYSPVKEEAETRASSDASIVDGVCSLAFGATRVIQIGGTPVGADCYISGFYLNTGDTLVIRNMISTRTKYPWSDFVSVTIP